MPQLRVFQPDESQWPATRDAIMFAFGVCEDDDQARDYLRPQAHRIALAREGDIVGGCLAYQFPLALPGGSFVPAAGLAGVGIVASEQGAGGLRLLIEAHLHNCLEQGDVVSGLMASESGLYGRFGYGVSTEMAEYRLETANFSLRAPLQQRGKVRLISGEEEGRAVCAQIHQAQSLAGEIQRSAGWWQQIICSGKRSWLGGGPQFVAVHYDVDGIADAYALYVVIQQSHSSGVVDGLQRCQLVLRELVALNATAEQAMFQYLCKIAWVRELRWQLAPIDPIIRNFMTDPRQLVQVSRTDMLWLRVLDMPRLLRQRQYNGTGDISFDYHDPMLPEFSGRFQLVVTTSGISVERLETDSQQVLQFGPEQLAAFVLGNTRVVRLHQLGEITGPVDAVRQLDSLMLTDAAPFNLSKF